MKRLLVNFMPKFLLKFLIHIKYKNIVITTHKQNITYDYIVRIECDDKIKNMHLKKILKNAFLEKIVLDRYRFYFYPAAIIKIPNTIEYYLKEIGAKSRNMNTKAIKYGVWCETFNYNEHLEEIFKINTSSDFRQGRKMDFAYREFPKKISDEYKQIFNIVHIGAKIDIDNTGKGLIVGYVELYVYGNFAMINRILGHKEYLKCGIMNLLIKACVEYAIESNSIKYINYLSMLNKDKNSLSAFKERVGFREFSIEEIR